MTKFLANSYFIFQRLECYTTLIVKELLYNKNQMFYFYFKKCRAYITVTVTNISNSIIKQYYVVIKLLRVLLILKKNSLAELIFLLRTGLSRLINKLSLISRICLSCPYGKMVNSSKDGIILQFTNVHKLHSVITLVKFLKFVDAHLEICGLLLPVIPMICITFRINLVRTLIYIKISLFS